jgi:hypothetical protein
VDLEADMSHRRRITPNLVLACFCSLTFFLSACVDPAAFGRDWEFYVRNESDQTWRIKVAIGGGAPDTYSVHEALPGADGVSVQWYGDREARIELLDAMCTVVGVFERDDDFYIVPGVDGIVGEIEPSGTRMDKWNTPEIGPISECGGSVHP